MGLQVLDSTIPGPPGPKGDKGDVGPGVINWRGAYDNATAYVLSDAVSYQGSSYICIAPTTGNGPTNASFWNLLAAKGDTGATGATGAAGADGLDITWRGAYDNGTDYVVNDAVSYQGSSYICKSPTTGNVPANATYWDLLASKGDQGNQGTQGVQGVQGAHGGAITIRYTISDQTGNTDPGNGNLRLDNFSAQNAATVIRVDHLDADGTDWSSVLPTLDDSTSTIKGHIRLVDPADQSKWLLFTVSSVGSETGYKNINVTNVGSSGANPFTNGSTVLLTFTQQGDKGDTGATGAAGADGLDITWRGAYDNATVYSVNDAVSYQGSSYIAIASTVGNLPTNTSFWNLLAQKGDTGVQGPAGDDGVVGAHGGGIAIEYTFDDTTTDSDPGNGLLRLSNSTQNAATVIRADHLDTNGTDWTNVLLGLDDTTSTNKGQVRLFKADDQSKWLVFSVSAVGSETGYKNIIVSNVASSATSPFSNGDAIVLAFTRTGDKGETGSTGAQGPQGDPGEDGLDINWTGAYDNGTTYSVNDAVSYQGSSYIAIATTIGNIPTNSSFWDLMAQKGDTGSAGSNGSNGADGQHGGGVTIEYTFSAATGNTDPGDGFLRLNQATQNTSNTIRADLLDRYGANWTSTLDSLDDSTSTVKGHIRLVSADDPAKWILFSVVLVSAPVGYRNINVTHVDSSAASPFAENDIVLLTFTRTGDKGDAGNTGATGPQGLHGGAIAISYTFSTTTTDSDPGSGNLRLNQATQNTATVIRADLLDSGGVDWTDVLDSLDDSSSTIKGHIRLVHATDYTKWIVFSVSAVASQTGYRNITVSVVDSSASSPFSNSDPVVLMFVRTGDQGTPGLTGSPGQDGQDGRHGGAITVEYTFSTTTTDSDPGNGNLRLNQTTQNTATVIRADLLDRNGTMWTSVLDTIDDSSSTVKGYVRLVRADDQSKWLLFSVSSLSSPTGYKNITVSNVASSENSPFVNGDVILLTFSRTGDKGDTGNTGATGATGAHGGAVAINYTFSTTTTDTDPGNGNLRLDNSTQSSATVIRVDLLDNLGVDWTDAIDNLAGPIPPLLGVNPETGQIRLVHKTDLTKWILFNLDGVETKAGYRNLYVTYIDSSSTNPFANSDQIVLAYAKNGKDGEDGQDGQPGESPTFSAIIDVYATSGAHTWTKRTGATRVTGILVGGGGGGGSGRKGANSSDRSGGTGGAGSGAALFDIDAASAGATETVTVGAGGAGGAAQATNSTNGNNGSGGGTTSFGAIASATGGGGGVGGATTGSTAPDNTSVGTGTYSGGTGGGGANGSGSPANAGGSPGQFFAGAGGGGGGGIGSGNSVGAAGTGGSTSFYAGGAAGATTPTSGSQGSATIRNHHGYGGSGGGGGGSNSASTSNTRAGGAGGYYGAGGGGGGAGRNDTSNSGAGGDGAQGIAIIVTYF